MGFDGAPHLFERDRMRANLTDVFAARSVDADQAQFYRQR